MLDFTEEQQFRLYVGIISSVHPPPSRKSMQMMREAEQEVEDDDADADPREQPVVVVDDEKTMPPAGAPRHAPHHKPDETDEARELQREHFREAKDLCIDTFFNDTEKDVKVFFSSYYRDKGLIWSEQRTRDGPVLIGFFLNFLLRDRARKELPATFVVEEALPDDFSDGCRELFGNMTQVLMWPNDDNDNAPAARHEIAVLVDPAVADKLIVGMGLGATWVQIVCQASTDPSEASTEKEKRAGVDTARQGSTSERSAAHLSEIGRDCMVALLQLMPDDMEFFAGEDMMVSRFDFRFDILFSSQMLREGIQ
ncbi:hypothetical protein B0H21DRAFT_828842 [Amylocystis lapponica]|nr:hypothetical protein B0H21DRAFT_828842 [Amylocystis lapponica]